MNRVREKRGSVERELAGCWDHDPCLGGSRGPWHPGLGLLQGAGPALSSASPAHWRYASGLTHLEKKLQRPPESRALAACPGPAARSPTSARLLDLSSFSPIT